MIEPFHIYNAEGRILRTGRALPTQPQVFSLDEHQGVGWAEPDTQYIKNSVVTDRPYLSVPPSYSVLVNTDWVIVDVPAGTEVEIDGQVVGTTDDTGLTLNFSASGIWPLVLHPPFPWLKTSCEVTVT